MKRPSEGERAEHTERGGSFLRNPTGWTLLLVAESLLAVGIATWVASKAELSPAPFLAIVIGVGVMLALLNYWLRRRLLDR